MQCNTSSGFGLTQDYYFKKIRIFSTFVNMITVNYISFTLRPVARKLKISFQKLLSVIVIGMGRSPEDLFQSEKQDDRRQFQVS